MDTHAAIRTRRTIHAFTPGHTLPAEVLDRALQAAHHAPCHKLTWPWRFRVVGEATRGKLIEAGIAMQAARGADEATCRPVFERKLATPSAILVVTQLRDEDPFRRQEDYAATACAVQNLMLSLHADGWGTKWGTGRLTRDPGALTVLGIDPDAEDMVGWIYIGRADKVPEIERPAVQALVQHLP